VKIAKQAKRDAKQLFRSCRTNGVLDEGRVRQVVEAVVVQKPRGYVAILSHLYRLVKLDLERRAARVESAVALSAAQQSSIQQILTLRYGNGLNLAFADNPALIGGMRVRVGSDVFDSSIQARLAALSESF
jgi:F-type H+-transporting ATPase subunit delta